MMAILIRLFAIKMVAKRILGFVFKRNIRFEDFKLSSENPFNSDGPNEK